MRKGVKNYNLLVLRHRKELSVFRLDQMKHWTFYTITEYFYTQ
jgi:hypothetical protein